MCWMIMSSKMEVYKLHSLRGTPLSFQIEGKVSEPVQACCDFLHSFAGVSQQNQAAMFEHLDFMLKCIEQHPGERERRGRDGEGSGREGRGKKVEGEGRGEEGRGEEDSGEEERERRRGERCIVIDQKLFNGRASRMCRPQPA